MGLQGKEIGGKDPKDYLKVSKVRNDGSWGTKDKSFSAAELLKTSIFTWNRFGERLCWNRHGHNKDNINNFGIYIDHSSGIHYDIVPSIVKK